MSKMLPTDRDDYRTETADGWQPISTAPKDGTRILLFTPDGNTNHDMFACVWGVYFRGRDAFSGWVEFDGYGDRPSIEHEEATHWQPLPTPPEAS